MRLLLSPVLAFHWMAVFAMLAVVSTISPGRGTFAALEFLGVAMADPAVQGSVRVSAVLSLGFMLAAALFLWTLIAAIFGVDRRAEAEEVSRYAFTAGVATLTALLMAGAVQQVEGLFAAIGTLLAALVVSYLAIIAERWSAAATAPAPVEEDTGIKTLALGAAHNALLSRISGRTTATGPEDRP